MARILLAEDDESMLNFLVLALERVGHTVIPKRNGMDALSVIENEEPVDLLLTDIVMPGLDGIELAQKATIKNPELKVMFITGFAAMAIKTSEISEKPDSSTQVMSKPFHLNNLVEQVEQLLAA